LEIETTDIIYSIVDIETTGGKFNQEKITEIAIFKIKNDGNISVYHQLINPKKKIQLFVQKLTGINNVMLKDKPIFEKIAVDVNNFTENSIFVAHNVNFDFRVLRNEFSQIGMKFSRDLICTIELSKQVFPEMKSYSLGKLVSNLGIKIKNRHRADGDAKATLDLFILLKSKMSQKELDKYIKKAE
tara:strand:- start:75 stop:632 length:558 start_codon:yes stop_codon:yes gene_type:complete